VKIRCPNCDARYELSDRDGLLAADGLAHCGRCNTTFDALDERMVEPLAAEPPPVALGEEDEWQGEQTTLPFEVPDDLEPLQASPDAALDIHDALYEKKSWRGAVYATLAVLLSSAIGLQLAWQYRLDLVERFPALSPLCDHLPCRPSVIHAPERFRVLQRGIKQTVNEPDSLTLSATIRNDAETAQRLPDMQLSLIDNNGTVLIRRRLSPADYVFPPPPDGTLIGPAEVVTITLDFKDPGHLASGFVIDFL
jgi:predicted Zn finger-like uncharacterized protein